MLLDDFKLVNTVIQIQYSDAYLLWDRAGFISKKLCGVWPDLKTTEARPNQQALAGKDVNLQTGLNSSAITLSGNHTLDQLRTKRIQDTFDIWSEALELTEFSRVSMRLTYAKEYDSMHEANSYIFGLNLARWPTSKVFDQPEQSDLNGLDISYRFEDESSFSVLRLKAERVKYEVDIDPAITENPEIRVTKNRAIIDFDRGLLGKVAVDKFRTDDWLKGYQHVLRRDLEKILKV
jgi:hypothetical protein